MNSGFSGTKGTVLNIDVSVNKGSTVIVLSSAFTGRNYDTFP